MPLPGIIALLIFGLGFVALRWIVRRTRGQMKRNAEAAEAALVSGDCAECIRLCDSVIAAARRMRLRPDDVFALTLVLRSEAAQKLERPDEALAAASQAFGCLRGVRNALVQVAVLDRLGVLLVRMRQERRAILVLEAAVGVGQAVDRDPLRNSSRLEHLGIAYLRVGVHTNSVAAFGRAIEIAAKQLGADALRLAGPYINLGNGYKRMHKMDDAERCYHEALRLYEVNGVNDPERYSTALLNLGVACAETGRNQDAEQYYRRVLDLRLAAWGRNDWRVGNTYNNLAMCKLRSRDFEAAEQHVDIAIQILDTRPESLSNALGTLSLLREEQGRPEEALAAATRAREVQQNLGTPDLSQLAERLDREGLLAARIGQQDRATDCRSRAHQLRQALASAPAPDSGATSATEALRTLDQRLKDSLTHVRALQHAL